MITPSRIFLAACIAVTFGIGVGIFFSSPPTVLLFTAGVGIVFIAFGFPRNATFGSAKWLPIAFGVALLAFALGAWRGSGAIAHISYQDVAQFGDSRVRIEGTVARYPDYRIEQSRYALGDVTVNGHMVAGRVLVFAQTEPRFSYGDRIAVEGKLRVPEPFDGFNYPRFLAKDGIVATMRAEEFSFIGSQEDISSGFVLAKIRTALDRSTAAILPAKESGILKALLVGDEGGMTENFKEALNRTGLRHIVAVSGMNITIIVGMVAGFFLGIGLWRQQAFWATIAVAALFVLVIGAPASAMRAALMGLSARAGPLLGRRASSLRLLIASFAVMAFLSPLSLLYDLGFQLSFAAAAGMVLLSEPFTGMIKRLSFPKIIVQVLATTFAAQVTALPLLFLTFGRMSLVFPFTNLAVLPLLPYVTVWGWAAAAAGMASSFLGTTAALPLALYFSFIAWVAETAAGIPVFDFSLEGVWGWSIGIAWWAATLFWVWRWRRSIPTPADRARALAADYTADRNF